MEDYFIVLEALKGPETADPKPGFTTKQQKKEEGYTPIGKLGFYISEIKRLWGVTDEVMCIQFDNDEGQYFQCNLNKFVRRHRDYLNLKK
jgi:hypothetical protein